MSAPRRLVVTVVLACVLVAGPDGVWADPHWPGEPISPTPLPPVTDWLWPDTSDLTDFHDAESVCQGLCSNGGSCFVNEYLETSCKCAGNWGGDHCTDNFDDSGSTGEHTISITPSLLFALIGMVITTVFIAVSCGFAYTTRKRELRRKALQRPFRDAGAAVPALNPDLSTSYHPDVHNRGNSAAPAGTYPRASGSNDNTDGPQRYTNPMAGPSGGGQRPTYDYAAGPGAGVAMPPWPLLEGVRPPMVGPRSELADRDPPPAYDYAYAHSNDPEPPPYSALSGPGT
jgi:hypothetical protein